MSLEMQQTKKPINVTRKYPRYPQFIPILRVERSIFRRVYNAASRRQLWRLGKIARREHRRSSTVASRLLRLRKGRAVLIFNMTDRLVNYVRARRRKAGLSQRDLAFILGYGKTGAVSRHELFRSIPPLIMALAYEVIFQTPIAELFPGLHETVEGAIERQITEFESLLLTEKSKRYLRSTREIDRKLQWVEERRQRRTTKDKG